MSYIMVDIEADGPIPGDYSMIAIGAVVVKPDFLLADRFLQYLQPISFSWNETALKITGFSREETLKFRKPQEIMEQFEQWVKDHSYKQPIFIADNNGFDWQFINWYFWHFLGRNPFGYSSRNLGDLYKGFVNDTFKSFKHLRKTPHTHNPLDDAMGNAESLLTMKEMGLKIKLE